MTDICPSRDMAQPHIYEYADDGFVYCAMCGDRPRKQPKLKDFWKGPTEEEWVNRIKEKSTPKREMEIGGPWIKPIQDD